MQNPVLIFEVNGIAKAAMEIFNSHNVVVYGFLTDDKKLHNTEIGEVTILGKPDDDGFLKLIGKKCEAFVATDDNAARKKLVNMLNKNRKVQPVNAIHDRAFLSGTVAIGHGNFINANSFIGADAVIGSHCLIHSNAVIEHEAKIHDFAQIGAGAIINSGAIIEEGAFIGSGAIIISGVSVGKNARVGAGSMVMSDVEKGQTVFGNPAAPISS